MIKQVLVRRYGQGLINVLRDEADFRKVREELGDLARLFFGDNKLREVLTSPFLAKTKKADLVRDIINQSAADRRTRNFILLLLEKGRFELLPEILDLLPLLWNEKTGIVTVEACSAVPLSDAQQERLRRTLESLESRPVDLKFTLDPEVLGGLVLRRGHVIYDLTLRGRLARLRDVLAEN
jgi:F-type H+-transporting ATPase subunit delta